MSADPLFLLIWDYEKAGLEARGCLYHWFAFPEIVWHLWQKEMSPPC